LTTIKSAATTGSDAFYSDGSLASVGLFACCGADATVNALDLPQ